MCSLLKLRIIGLADDWLVMSQVMVKNFGDSIGFKDPGILNNTLAKPAKKKGSLARL